MVHCDKIENALHKITSPLIQNNKYLLSAHCVTCRSYKTRSAFSEAASFVPGADSSPHPSTQLIKVSHTQRRAPLEVQRGLGLFHCDAFWYYIKKCQNSVTKTVYVLNIYKTCQAILLGWSQDNYMVQ